MHTLLDQEAPGLSTKLEALSLRKRREVVATACAVVAELLRDLMPETRVFLEKLMSGPELAGDDVTAAQALADVADEQYFDLQAQREEQSALKPFSEARLLTAIARGFGGTSPKDTADAVYELCKAYDDPAPVIRAVEAAILQITS